MTRPPFKPSRTYIAIFAFLVGFTVLLIIVGFYYLVPAMDAARNATPNQRRSLAAYSTLLLAVVLFVIFAGLFLTFRIGRFFFPRKTPPRTHTKYVDAWAEAGKRLTPPKD
jgi:uncharacterized membrane protein YfcA